MSSIDQHGEILRLLRENNRMLKKQEKRARFSFIWRIIWFLVIVGVPLVVSYYLKDTLTDIFSSVTSIQQAQDGAVDVNALLEMYGVTLPGSQ